MREKVDKVQAITDFCDGKISRDQLVRKTPHLRTGDVVKILGVSASTIRFWMDKKVNDPLPAVRFNDMDGAHRYIPTSEFFAWMDRKRNGGHAWRYNLD